MLCYVISSYVCYALLNTHFTTFLTIQIKRGSERNGNQPFEGSVLIFRPFPGGKKLPVPLEGPAIPGKSPSPRHIRILLEKRKKGTQPRIPPFFWTRLRFLWSHSTSPSPSTGRRVLKRWHGLLPLKVNRVKREQQLRGNLNVREHRKS